MKLAIGTAQFGLDYGVSNKDGQVSNEDVNKILKAATKSQITTIDTASDYGNSEQVLGKVGVKYFDVITKIGAVPESITDVKSWVCEQIEGALVRLNLNSIYGFLLHRPNQLLGKQGDIIFDALSQAQSQRLIKKIGVSIYDPAELTQLINRFDFNIVQAPMNIIDRRLHSSGWLERLNKLGVEVHVRSVFLQGLLLMKPELRPSYFRWWNLVMQDYDNWLNMSKIPPIEACIGFVKQFNSVDKIIVGVLSPTHLEGICKAISRNGIITAPSNIQSDDINLINPSKWIL